MFIASTEKHCPRRGNTAPDVETLARSGKKHGQLNNLNVSRNIPREVTPKSEKKHVGVADGRESEDK